MCLYLCLYSWFRASIQAWHSSCSTSCLSWTVDTYLRSSERTASRCQRKSQRCRMQSASSAWRLVIIVRHGSFSVTAASPRPHLCKCFITSRLCGLVVRVSGYRYRGPGFDHPALPDFLSSSGSGTGSTHPREPREVNWGATWMKKVAAPGLENRV